MKSNRGYLQTLDNCERIAQNKHKKLWNYKLEMPQSFPRELLDSAIKIIQEVITVSLPRWSHIRPLMSLRLSFKPRVQRYAF